MIEGIGLACRSKYQFLEQEELDSYHSRKETDRADEGDEDAWEPENCPRKTFGVFNDSDD